MLLCGCFHNFVYLLALLPRNEYLRLMQYSAEKEERFWNAVFMGTKKNLDMQGSYIKQISDK